MAKEPTWHKITDVTKFNSAIEGGNCQTGFRKGNTVRAPLGSPDSVPLCVRGGPTPGTKQLSAPALGPTRQGGTPFQVEATCSAWLQKNHLDACEVWSLSSTLSLALEAQLDKGPDHSPF